MKYQDYMLVDGGAVNNFPTDVAKRMGADIIIGVNLNTAFKKKERIPTLMDLTAQLAGILTARKDSANKARCDILIEPNLTGYNSSSFSNEAADTLIRRGKESAMAVIDQIRTLKKKYNLQPRTITDSLTALKTQKIAKIQFSGKYSLPAKLLLEVINLRTPGTYDLPAIKKSIENLYGLGVFNRVYFAFIDKPEGETLDITVEERKNYDLNVGMRLNTRSMVSVILNATRKNFSNTVNFLSFTADVSNNPRFNFLAEMNKNKLPKLALALEGSYSDMKIHTTKNYTNPASIYYGSAKLYTYQRVLNYSLIGLGIKEDYYIGNIYDAAENSGVVATKIDNAISNYYVFYNFDNLDNFYYPTSGAQIYSEFVLAHDYKSYKDLHPIVLLKLKNVQSIGSNLALLTGINTRFIMRGEKTPVFLRNYLVPTEYEAFYYHHLPFYGLPSVWAVKRNVAIGSLGVRYNAFKKSYFTLSGNYMLENDEFDQFKNYQGTWGLGVTYSYKTPVGPIELTLGYSNAYQKLIVSGNVGFWF